jgi:hypothetical protein
MRGYSTSIDDYRAHGYGYVARMELTPGHPAPEADGPDGPPSPQPAAPPAEPAPPAAAIPAAAPPRSTGQEIGGRKFRVNSADAYVPFRSRTKRRRRVATLVALLVLALGAGAYGVFALVGSDHSTPAAAPCPVAAVAEKPAQPAINPQQITLNVYNSTNRQGLAASTAAALKQRGFTIGKVANDPLGSHLTISAQVRGAAGAAGLMKYVAAEVPGAQLQSDSRTDQTVDLVLGTGFAALASPAQVTAALTPPSMSASSISHCAG